MRAQFLEKHIGCIPRFLTFLAMVAFAQAAQSENVATTTGVQMSFASPQEAATALIEAAANYDVPVLLQVFGPEGKDFVSSTDPVADKKYAQEFTAKARQKYTISLDPKNPARATILIGSDSWPVPVPLVKKGSAWYFDSKAGRKEILFRRIGENELDAIQICRGFVDAQKDYAAKVHDDSGIHQYAQRIISTSGKQDGLYWKNPDGSSGGPIAEAVAKAIEEGYSANPGSGYHGYYFKVLKGQGPAARLGRLDYVINGTMIGGFALLAIPAEYRVTGVQTFMVSYDGIVYEKDLGPDTVNLAKQIDLYNPDPTWHRSDDQWPSDASLADN